MTHFRLRTRLAVLASIVALSSCANKSENPDDAVHQDEADSFKEEADPIIRKLLLASSKAKGLIKEPSKQSEKEKINNATKCGSKNKKGTPGVFICSNGPKIRVNSDEGIFAEQYIEVVQERLYEWDGSNSVQKIELNTGGENAMWMFPEKDKEGLVALTYQTVVAREEQEKETTFRMTASLQKKGKTNLLSFVPCEDCTKGTAGPCKSSNGRCKKLSGAGTCPKSFKACKAELEVDKEELAFAFLIEDWHFKAESHKIRYQVKLNIKSRVGGSPSREDVAKIRDEILNTPSGSLIVDANFQIRVHPLTLDIVTPPNPKNQIVLNFETPKWPDGWRLFYNFPKL